MFSQINSRILAILLVGAWILQVAYYYERLPAEVASGFSGGNPTGYLSKNGFLLVYAASFLGSYVFLTGIGRFLGRIPNSMINMPNRDYWLAEERRSETVARIRTWLSWYANLTLLFLLGLFQILIQANMRNPVGYFVSEFLFILLSYLAGNLLMVVVLILQFRQPVN